MKKLHRLASACFGVAGLCAVINGQVTVTPFPKPPQPPVTAPPPPTVAQTAGQAIDPSAEGASSVLMPDLEDLGSSVGAALALLNPSVRYQFQYGDGVPSRDGRRTTTEVHRLTPAVLFRFAERITFSYSPSMTWYSSESLEDRTDHRAALMVGGIIGENSVSFSQTYSVTNLPLIETGRQTRQEQWGTNLSVGIPLGQRTSLNVGAAQNLRSTREFTDVKTWSGSAFFYYQKSQNLKLGVGTTGAYNSIDPGLDLFSQQVSGRVDWSYGSKLSVGLTGGADLSRFKDSDRGTIANPIYGGNLSYRIFDRTELSASMNRSVGASYFSNTLRESTRFSVGLRQNVFRTFNLRLGVSQSSTDYESALRSTSSARDDERWAYSASLGTPFLRKFSLSFSYQYFESKSNLSNYNYNSSLMGVSVGWRL